MKKLSVLLSAVLVSALLVTGCAGSGVAAGEPEGASETAAVTAAEAATEEAATEDVEETAPEETRYVGTEEEIEEYSGNFYRVVWDKEENPKLYWLTMREDGSLKYVYETRDTDPRAIYDGTWDVNEHGHVHLKMDKVGGNMATASEALEGNFRFLRNEQNSMNIILITGDDIIESAEGSVQTFLDVSWYEGQIRFKENPEDSIAVTFETLTDAGSWFPITGMKSDCKFEVQDGVDGDGNAVWRTVSVYEFCEELGDREVLCRFALSQQHLLVKIQMCR